MRFSKSTHLVTRQMNTGRNKLDEEGSNSFIYGNKG